MRAQMVGQLIHRHPVDAGTTLVLPHTLQRGLEVLAFAHQSPSGRYVPERSFPLPAGRRFLAPRCLRGFTPYLLCARTLIRTSVTWRPSRLAGVSLSPSFGPSPPPPKLRRATTTSADFSLRLPSSPFQAQGEISPGKNIDLHRTTAGFTSPCLGHNSFAVIARSPCSAPPPIRFLFIGPRLRSPLPSRRPRRPTLCGSLRSL